MLEPSDKKLLRQALNWIRRFKLTGDGVSGKSSLDGGCAYQISWPPRDVVPRLSNQFCFAKLTSQDATNKWWYNWSEAQPTSSGWALKSGGRTGSTTATPPDPAMLLDSGATFDVTSTGTHYVLLVRTQPDASGQSGWIICSPFGQTGDSIRWGQVQWDGTSLTQGSTTGKYICGMLQAEPARDSTLIDTPDVDCA
jgi:hypothetical protein